MNEKNERAAWWALVVGAAAALEDAANHCGTVDSERAALGAANHYRQRAQELFDAAPSASAHFTMEHMREYAEGYYNERVKTERSAPAQQAEPVEGWKLVPVHPTKEMREAGAKINGQGWDFAHHTWNTMLLHAPAAPAPSASPAAPIDMVLHCPRCGAQHIDAPEVEPGRLVSGGPSAGRAIPPRTVWDNPPHRSHLCHGCGHVWRPADVPTNGVAAVKTKGNADSPLCASPAALTDATIDALGDVMLDILEKDGEPAIDNVRGFAREIERRTLLAAQSSG